MGIIYNTSIVRDGLVLYLDAANPKSYPGTGTSWFDLKGNNNGTLINGPVFNSGNNGYFTFDGTNDYALSSNFTPNITNKTFCVWVLVNSITQQGGGTIGLERNDGVLFDSIVYNETNQGWGFGSNSFARTSWSGVKETNINWVYMCATYSNNNYKLYRNGLLIHTNTQYGVLNFNFSSRLTIGFRHTGGNPSNIYFNGGIGLTKLYNKALSAEEVRINFEATRGRYGI